LSSELYNLWRQIDINGSGVINFSEFTSVIFPNVDIEALAEEAAQAGEIKSLQAQMSQDEERKTGVDEANPSEKPSLGSFVRVETKGEQQQQAGPSGGILANALRQAKASDHVSSGAQSGAHATLSELLSSMKEVQASLERVAGRVEHIESGQVALKSRFDTLEAALARGPAPHSQSVHPAAYVINGHDSDFVEADRACVAVPTKESPPNQSTGQRRRRHRQQSASRLDASGSVASMQA